MRFKEVKKLISKQNLSEDDLFEIKMTGKNLSQLAKNIKDVRVGLEFEMIVPNVSNDEDSDQEPDYDQDVRVRDIDDAVNFFDDGDYNGRNEIRRLRERMESDYFDWQREQIDQEWGNNGFEFFQEYLDREEPFDPEDYQERAEDEIKAEFPELDPTSEDFGELVAEKLREINAEYYVEQWEEQGRLFDRAREEFEDEQRDNYSEQDWLSDQNIRFASDVESNYSDVTWPYYTSNSDDGEDDIKNVALDFMNAMGMDTVAVSNSYHGSYEKWNGNDWVRIGNNKPADAFTIEPDGSLDGDNNDDVGLEFVSPPIPLEDIGTVMSKVQNWAGNYGAYTGNRNKTSMHTNISVPGYDISKLDYVKAALLLGDEYVLREFERFGNTYAKPAIEKVRQLVKAKPEKAQELLDKMKSQLNAEASKLIHSGTTDKFTSINTKNNRIEYRSPGGDYLSDIADNPKKLMDTINRMVVTMDAAMDPEKYKQEYQKKLYKLLTGQESGREGATGNKKEMKKDDKDLLNIFSRYAAGELPRAALKSFVRQAQLERSVAKGKETAQAPAEQGNWGIWATSINRFVRAPGQIDNSVLRRFPSRAAAEQFLAQTRAERPDMRTDVEVREIKPSTVTTQEPGGNGRPAYTMTRPAEPIAGSTLDLQRQRAAQQGVDTSVDYELYNRFTGTVIDTFPARNDDEARVRLDDYRNLGAGAFNPEAFGVRRGPGVTNTASSQRSNATPQTSDQAQDGIIDVEPDVAQNFAPQTLTRPGQGQQVFTGEWQVVDNNNQELYRFSGVGNSQGDANRVAQQWINAQRAQGNVIDAREVDVLPVMGEA